MRGFGMVRDAARGILRPSRDVRPPGDDRPTLGKRARRALAQVGPARLLLTFALLVIGLILARMSWQLPLMVDAERAFYDMRATVSAPHVEQDARITMVTYTDETLFATGIRSPVDRAILTRALAQLDRMGAASIGIDLLFDSPTPADAALLAQLRAMRTPTFIGTASPATNPNNIQFAQFRFLRQFLEQAAGPRTHPASIRLAADADSVARRWPGVPTAAPHLLASAMAGTDVRVRQGTPTIPAWERFTGAIRFRMPALVAEAAGGVETREVFAKLPIDTLADPAVAPFLAEEIRGRHILIGGDIIDTDMFSTPLSRLPDPASGERTQMIGLEVHATMLAQILDRALPRRIPDALLWAGAMLAVILGAITALADVRPATAALLTLLQAAALIAAPFLLQGQGIETLGLPVGGSAIGWLAGFIGAAAALRAVNAEERSFAQSALGKYLPRDIAQQILRDPEKLALHGEKREIFCLFSDLEGFTKMSHAITPENVARILNAYLDALSGVVLAHGGTIDKFVGDAVVAFWGAPIAHANDGEQAARALLAMAEAGEQFRDRIASWDDGALPPIGRTRVGLHRGEAVVGNFGGEGRMQYTALGDSMNTAARLESANKVMHTRALASVDALAAAGDARTQFVPMGRVQLRGRARAVDVFEPRPDLGNAERADVTAVVAAHDAGDSATYGDIVARIRLWAANDASVTALIARLDATKPGGHYVLS
jgi:adenylate cyclase